jgi:hypothetical protein
MAAQPSDAPSPALAPLALPMLPALVAGGQIGAGWRVVTLPQQKSPVTRYSAESVAGRPALRVEARASYGNLVFEPAGVIAPAAVGTGVGTAAGTMAPRRVAWAWRVQQRNAASDISQKAGDDLAVKVCLSFELPLAQVPFVERQLLRLARSRTGENLPAATLCWVWGGSALAGQVLDNPYSRRVRYIVLRTQAEALDTWFEESREVAADFKRAFGDEAPTLPPLAAVVVAGDADNTGEHSIAHVAALRWLP